MNPLSATDRVVQAVGITASAFLAGTVFSASSLAAPALRSLPTRQLLIGWAKMYDIGASLGPPMGLFGLANHLFVAYKLYQAGSPKWLFALAAGALTMSNVPYTLIVMAPTNLKLHTAADKLQSGKAEVVMEDKEALDLLSFWQTANYIRAVPAIAAAALALWPALW